MLRVEVKRRIPETMNDEAGPWRLLSWLDQIQPPISVNGIVFPPFSIQQLADEFLSLIPANPNQDLIRESLITIVRQSVDSERSHVLQTIRELLEQTQNRLEIQIAERLETLETFIEGLALPEKSLP